MSLRISLNESVFLNVYLNEIFKFIPSFQLKVPRTNCEQIALPSSSRACEHVHLKKNIYIYIYIYELGYCYEDRR